MAEADSELNAEDEYKSDSELETEVRITMFLSRPRQKIVKFTVTWPVLFSGTNLEVKSEV